jgi:hypothetical protein
MARISSPGASAVLPVGGEEAVDGHAPLAGVAHQHQRSIGRRQHRHAVGGGRGVGDVAAQGGTVLDLDPAHLAGRLGQRRRQPRHQRIAPQLGEGGERADDQAAAPPPDPAQLAQRRQIEERPRRRRAEVEADVHVGAAGQRLERALVAQEAQRLAERPRLVHDGRREGRPHRAPLRLAASTAR